jgi:hypothetical protein
VKKTNKQILQKLLEKGKSSVLITPLLAYGTMSKKLGGSIADRVETAVLLGHGFIGPERDNTLDGEEYMLVKFSRNNI